MVVCHCNAVNDRVIRELIAAGAMELDDVINHCGAGARCGGCLDTVRLLMESYRSVEPQPVAIG